LRLLECPRKRGKINHQLQRIGITNWRIGITNYKNSAKRGLASGRWRTRVGARPMRQAETFRKLARPDGGHREPGPTRLGRCGRDLAHPMARRCGSRRAWAGEPASRSRI
jgi:hypothetical protein